MRRLHVAVLDEELPFPLTSGKRIRTYGLISRLAERHRVTWLCHRGADPAEVTAAEREFARLGIAVRQVERRIPAQRGLPFAGRLLGNLLSPLPYSVAVHTSRELTSAAQSLLAADPPDLWQCEWTPYAQTLRHMPNAGPWVAVAHNVETTIWERLRDAEANPLKRRYIAEQARKFARFERWAAGAATRIVTVSAEDAARYRERFAAERVSVVDNGVDTAYFAPPGHAGRDPRLVLFLGSLDWRPNLDAVSVLLEQIAPRVLAAEPAARFRVVGRNPPEWLRHLVARTPGADLLASVPDVRPHLAAAGMLAVPLRSGGGSRLKILEALATATPVVSTPVGAEGLHLAGGEHLTLAAEPEAFAAALIEAMRRPTAMQAQAERGRDVVCERYDWESLAERLEAVWYEVARASPGVGDRTRLANRRPVAVECS